MPASHACPDQSVRAANAEDRQRREFRRNLKWMKIQSVLFYALAGLVVGFVLGELSKGFFS